MIQPNERRRWVQCQPGLAAAVVNEPDGSVDVLGRFGVKSDDRGARLGEVGHDAIDWLYHQVHIDRYRQVWLQRLTNQRSDRKVGNVVVVHDVEVNQVGASSHDCAYFVPETREISGEDGRGNEAWGHGAIILPVDQ